MAFGEGLVSALLLGYKRPKTIFLQSYVIKPLCRLDWVLLVDLVLDTSATSCYTSISPIPFLLFADKLRKKINNKKFKKIIEKQQTKA